MYPASGEFILTETATDTETKTDKMATVANAISVSVQYEHLHTILLSYFICEYTVTLKNTIARNGEALQL